MKLRVWNKLKQWYNESKELSRKRMDMLVEKFTVEELIEYRDNYEKNRKIISNFMLIIIGICLMMTFIFCLLEELSVITEDECSLYFGYFFGLSIGLLIVCPTGSYERRLTKAIEDKYLRERGLKI